MGLNKMTWRVAVLWGCLVVRLAFYAAMIPLWEGVDEWAHFSVAQSVALRGELLSSRDRPISKNIEASLRLTPLPWNARHLDPPSVTHDLWWQLPQAERARRSAELRSMPVEWAIENGGGAFTNYEALHAPLYYWTVAPLLWLLRGATLAGQVFGVRCLTALLGSLVLPLLYLIALEVFQDERIAFGCAAVVAVMPGFAGVVAHVCNDAFAAPIYTAMVLGAVVLLRRPSLAAICATGTALGLGLLTKAYFLTAVPPVFALLLWHPGKTPRRWRVVGCALPVAIA